MQEVIYGHITNGALNQCVVHFAYQLSENIWTKISTTADQINYIYYSIAKVH